MSQQSPQIIDDDPSYLFLGIDIGTQSIKSTIISIPSSLHLSSFQILHSTHVHYDSECPHYHTKGGVLIKEEENTNNYKNQKNEFKSKIGKVVSSPILMFVEALEMLMEKIPEELRRRIKCIGGSAQQHGSVYVAVSNGDDGSGGLENVELWKRREDGGVGVWNLKENDFALKNCPIWMDSSTSEICKELEKGLGGAEQLMKISGSTAHERFTASQIVKFSQHVTERSGKRLDQCCERICLISSFFSSYFVGAYQSIDFSDGSGMNLLDIHNLEWSKEIMQTISTITNESQEVFEKVLDKNLIPSNTIIGKVHQKLCEKFHFSTECQVCCFSGDNQNSSSFLLRSNHDICISLGTSHTIFGLMNESSIHSSNLEGHIFINPSYRPLSSEEKFLYLLCFKNGGMVRDLFCSKYCNGDWKEFEQLLDSPYPTPIQNDQESKSIDHLIGFYFQFPEITPHTPQHVHNGFYRFVKYSNCEEYELLNDEQFQHLFKECNITQSLKIMDLKSLILSQFMSLRKHAQDNGLLSGNDSPRIILTGGASNSLILLQQLSNVFNSSVHIIPNAADSTTLGAATRAFYSYSNHDYSKSFHEITLPILPPLQQVCQPQLLTNNLSYPNALIDLSLYSKLESKLLTLLDTASI